MMALVKNTKTCRVFLLIQFMYLPIALSASVETLALQYRAIYLGSETCMV
jgi:hypothetical protein